MRLWLVRYYIRHWVLSRPDKLAWWLAWKLPRRVALFAFVRVCGATGNSPSQITYASAYDAWVQGAGK